VCRLGVCTHAMGLPFFLSTQTNKYAYICSGDPRGGHAVRGRPQALAGGKGGQSISHSINRLHRSINHHCNNQTHFQPAVRSIGSIGRSITQLNHHCNNQHTHCTQHLGAEVTVAAYEEVSIHKYTRCVCIQSSKLILTYCHPPISLPP
jgi:GTP cyclohydrolase III